jgi:ABC-type tungstate transport system substrate-binding protein
MVVSGAMTLAQTILATPIVMALIHRAVEEVWGQYGGALMVDGATRLRAIPHLIAMAVATENRIRAGGYHVSTCLHTLSRPGAHRQPSRPF